MSVYLLLALAFGTMSGAVATPVSRPSPVLIAQQSGGADREVVRLSAITAPRRLPLAFALVSDSPLRHEAPLTGSASPRAPAAN